MSTEAIYNRDGSVYMTFGPSAESSVDREGWMVKRVFSGSHHPKCANPGTHSFTTEDCESFNGLLRILGDLRREYGYSPGSRRVTGSTLRWTFERLLPDGHRVTDMVIASKIH